MAFAVIDATESPPKTAQKTPKKQAKPINLTETVKTITNFHIFGVADESIQASADGFFNAPKTSLTLKLLGVFANSENTENSTAIISEASGRHKRYKIGDSLPGNATLKQVFTDRVVIERNGIKETLRFKKYDVISSNNTSPTSQSRSSSSSNQSLYNSNSYSSSNNARSSKSKNRRARAKQTRNTSQQRTSSRSSTRNSSARASSAAANTEEIVSYVKSNKDALMQQWGVERTGEGLKVKANSPLRTFGLKGNDVVVSINGKSASQLEQSDAAVKAIIQNKQATLKVNRNGKIITISPSI